MARKGFGKLLGTLRAKLTLRKKMSIAFVTLAIIPMLVMTAVTLHITEQSMEKSAYERNSILATDISGNLNQLLVEKTRMLKIAAANSDVKSMDFSRQVEALKELTANHSDLLMAIVVDVNGKLLVRSDGKIGEGNYSDREYFQTVRRTGETAYSDALVSKTTGKLAIMIAEPIKNDDQTLHSVLIIGIDLQNFIDFIEQTNIGSSGYAYVVNKNGNVLIHPNRELVGSNRDISSLTPVKAALSKQTGCVEYEFNGQKKLAGYSYIPLTGWGVVAQQPLSEALAEAISVRNISMLMTIFAVVLAMVLGFVVAGLLVKPIEEIAAATVRVAAGDIPIKLEITTQDEIGQLAGAFNNMVAEVMTREIGLRASEEKYRRLHKELLAIHEELAASEEELRQQVDELIVREEQIYRQNVILTLLHETALGLMNSIESDEVLKKIVYDTAALFGASSGCIVLFDEQDKTYGWKVGTGIFAQIEMEGKITEGIIGKTYESGEFVAVDNYCVWEHRLSNHAFDEIHYVASVPLKNGERMMGAFSMAFSDLERTLDDREIYLLQRFADLVSLALSNAQLVADYKTEIQERKQIEEDLRSSEEKFSEIFQICPDGIALVRYDGTYIEVNEGFSQMSGYSKAEVIEESSLALCLWIDPRDWEHMIKEVKRHGEIFNLEIKIRRKDGDILYSLISARSIKANGKESILFITRDISERKKAEEKLKYVASYDALTGCYNRSYFEEKLTRTGAERNYPIGLIICDINGMKLFNDTLGHAAGDRLLKIAAEILQHTVREEDVVARIGGDEFAIILLQADEHFVESVCERIREKISEHNRGTNGVDLSISLGYTVSGLRLVSAEALFKEADDSMYREKMHHKQSVRSDMVQTAMKLLEVRDFNTEGHADRLQGLAIKLSRKHGLAEKRIADIRLLAQFHDIGKVGIPDNILLKPDQLTAVEKKEMQRHVEIGYRIAHASSELSPIADWILKHHEWWNGQGYPVGLKGEDIPIECRILAIIDAYDAMTNDRPYRKAMSEEAAIDELRRNAGIQFDPKLVGKFIAMEQSKRFNPA